ncbi:EF-hand domain-containing family member C2-like [Venturia canescens]|uniref:EF-hand domain-containing family member C2-like n=1 Tax=Venturia canescens TaxID=32260 RepID=UPI001C9D2834|nr:EF-hand domain-containing family member C2-like [Venturia canescens]
MRRAPKLPCLPGFNFDTSRIGQTKFPRSHVFEKIHEGVYYLAEEPGEPQFRDDPSVYPRGEAQVLPTWLAFDGQRLMFKAYFQETVQERWQACFQVRVVMITYFLEDGTMKIVEPAIDNSGLEQGVLLRRQRIPLPSPVKNRYYDILDLNIGKEPEIFGRVYRIVDCDKFTRRFLTRMGIPVPDPIEIPNDHYNERREMFQYKFAKKPNRRSDTLGKFLKNDRKVLRFYGYWDDTINAFGLIHDLEIHFFLADDTMELKEINPPDAGRENGAALVKKMKIPKFFTSINPIGSADPFTVLNVFGENTARSYYMIDSLNTGTKAQEYYKENDLTIGAQLDIFGRKVVITDMDPFTREYYRTKYGINDFEPLERPKDDRCDYTEKKNIPPHNGFGSYDDSLCNCFSVTPKAPKVDVVRIHEYDNQILRFRAKMISNIPDNDLRHFLIKVFTEDDTISIFELARENSGFETRLFQSRMKVMLPGQDIYSSEKPEYYEPPDFYIGGRVNLSGFQFQITAADDFALSYMEKHCDKFPKANAKLIMKKIREALGPVYREFIAEFGPKCNDDGVWEYRRLREAMCKYLGDQIVEHEIITIARAHSSDEKRNFITREFVRRLIHTEITRLLWNELDRLKEYIHHVDEARTGYLPRSELWTILRGSKIPVDPEILNLMLDHLNKNVDGLIDYQDMLQFMDTTINPITPMQSVSVKTSLWWASEKDPNRGAGLDWCSFLNDLDIKENDPAPQTLAIPSVPSYSVEGN